MKINELESISFSREGFKPHVKCPIIWGHKGIKVFPICYLRKPKYMSKEDWDDFLDCFKFEVYKK